MKVRVDCFPEKNLQKGKIKFERVYFLFPFIERKLWPRPVVI